jgi:hypothetical protein
VGGGKMTQPLRSMAAAAASPSHPSLRAPMRSASQRSRHLW